MSYLTLLDAGSSRLLEIFDFHFLSLRAGRLAVVASVRHDNIVREPGAHMTRAIVRVLFPEFDVGIRSSGVVRDNKRIDLGVVLPVRITVRLRLLDPE